jgi:hypothetical protein
MYKRLKVIILSCFLGGHACAQTQDFAEAFDKVRDFFALPGNQLKLAGSFVDTPAEYGRTCEFIIDLASTESAYITLKGEYAAATVLGEGIYFNQAESSFSVTKVNDRTLLLEQELSDSPGSGLLTHMQIIKTDMGLQIDLDTTRSLWWFTDTVSKHCRIVNSNPNSASE